MCVPFYAYDLDLCSPDRVRVHLSKHIPLTSLGSITCPKTSREIVKAFVSGIPEHHQQGSTFVSIEAPTGPSEPLPRCARQNTNVILDASGHFVNPAIYRFEQNRASSGCLYFDNEGLEIYRELLSPQVCGLCLNRSHSQCSTAPCLKSLCRRVSIRSE